jgi:predicted GIY-YIG superfamily endonuclease
MTRFKELQRIENAIKYRDVRDLEWEVKYREMKIPIATMEQHVKHWTKLLKKVQMILDQLNEIQA